MHVVPSIFFSIFLGSCLIGIAVDNEFTAYLNGKTIASSNSYSVLNTYEVDSDEVTSSVALIIDAHNTNGLSGILVASNDGIFSSNNGWFCANKEVFDGSDSWKDNEMSASGAQNWFQATVVASFTSGIWNKNDYNKVPSIQVKLFFLLIYYPCQEVMFLGPFVCLCLREF